MYVAVTHRVKVTVKPTFEPERSDPEERRYFWRYDIEIANLGDKSVTLIERHWRITDAKAGNRKCAGRASSASSRRLSPGRRSGTRPAAR